MLVLAFHVGKDRFALRCGDIVEVVPRVHLRDVPHAPASISGIFTYRGAVVPVIDLAHLMWGTPCAERLSSRIILVRQAGRLVGLPGRSEEGIGRDDRPRVVGLLAERVTEAITLDAARAAPSGLAIADAPYLGEVFFDDTGMIQLLRLDRIFEGEAGRMLTAGEAGQ
jgi:chemotaxis-related protein WspB